MTFETNVKIRENRKLPVFIVSRLCHGDRLSNWLIHVFPFVYVMLLVTMQSCSSPLGRDSGHFRSLFPHWDPVGERTGFHGMWILPGMDLSRPPSLHLGTAAAFAHPGTEAFTSVHLLVFSVRIILQEGKGCLLRIRPQRVKHFNSQYKRYLIVTHA